MADLGKIMVVLGFLLMVAGALIWKTGSLGALGRLPGDLWIQKGNSTFIFPVVSCLLLSALLTLLSWLFRRF